MDRDRTPPFSSIEQFDAVHAQLGGEPDGLEARYVGTVDGAPRVVMLWTSKAHADRLRRGCGELMREAVAIPFGTAVRSSRAGASDQHRSDSGPIGDGLSEARIDHHPDPRRFMGIPTGST